METGPAGAEGVRRRAVASGAGAEDEPEGVGETEPEEGRARGGARLDWAPRRPPEPRHTGNRAAPVRAPGVGQAPAAPRLQPPRHPRPPRGGGPGRGACGPAGGLDLRGPGWPTRASPQPEGPRWRPPAPRPSARAAPAGSPGPPASPSGEGAATFVCPQWVASERETMKEARPLQSFLPSREKDSGWEQSALTALAQRGRKPIVMRPKDPGLETSGTTSQKHLGFEALQGLNCGPGHCPSVLQFKAISLPLKPRSTLLPLFWGLIGVLQKIFKEAEIQR